MEALSPTPTFLPHNEYTDIYCTGEGKDRRCTQKIYAETRYKQKDGVWYNITDLLKLTNTIDLLNATYNNQFLAVKVVAENPAENPMPASSISGFNQWKRNDKSKWKFGYDFKLLFNYQQKIDKNGEIQDLHRMQCWRSLC